MDYVLLTLSEIVTSQTHVINPIVHNVYAKGWDFFGHKSVKTQVWLNIFIGRSGASEI